MVIYKISHPESGRVYIGQSIRDVSKRFTEHKSRLKKGNHFNQILQSIYNKYGLESLIFTCLCRADSVTHLNILENRMIVRYKSDYKNGGMNIASAGDNRAMSDVTKERISKALLGNTNGKYTAGIKRAKRNISFGRTCSEATRAKISVALKGISIPRERAKKAADGHKKPIEQYGISGDLLIVHPSTKDASLSTGIRSSLISCCIAGRYKTAGGFIWKRHVL